MLFQIIDISTDGVTNFGVNVTAAADQAIADGIYQINCLAVELDISTICTWLRGPNSFARAASSFAVTPRARVPRVPES